MKRARGPGNLQPTGLFTSPLSAAKFNRRQIKRTVMRYCGMCYGTAAHRLWFYLESRREADRLGPDWPRGRWIDRCGSRCGNGDGVDGGRERTGRSSVRLPDCSHAIKGETLDFVIGICQIRRCISAMVRLLNARVQLFNRVLTS